MTGILTVDGNRCTGCELCADSLPGVFKINSEGISEVLNSEGASAAEVREVIESCPAECIVYK